MARTVATLPPGSRITDYNSLGVIAKAFPLTSIRATLADTRRNHRGVKHKMSNFPLRPRHVNPLPSIDICRAIRILK